jgi:site-specific DNA recombinase
MRHKANAKAGKAHGGLRPFGYARAKDLEALNLPDQMLDPGELVVVPEEAEAIREAAHRVLRGSTLTSIVVDFNERGVPSASGAKWRPSSLSKVLRSGRIAGLREAGDEVVGEGNWEPILDPDTWARVRSRITHAPIGRRPRRNLLAGMCRCAECGTTMAVLSEGTDVPGGRRTIACDKANRHGCGSNSAKAEAVEQVVLEYLYEALSRVNIAQARARRTVESTSALVASIAADKEMLTDLAADYGHRRLDKPQWLAAKQPIEDRLAENQRKLDQVAADADMDDAAFESLTPARFEELDLDQKRAVLRLFVDHVEIRKGRPGRHFDPTRVRVVPA